ncbi:hypothetical protein V6N13_054481 [Hibiscus sabdariffa]
MLLNKKWNMALKVLDMAIQAHGGSRTSSDTVLARLSSASRTLRFADEVYELQHLDKSLEVEIIGDEEDVVKELALLDVKERDLLFFWRLSLALIVLIEAKRVGKVALSVESHSQGVRSWLDSSSSNLCNGGRFSRT